MFITIWQHNVGPYPFDLFIRCFDRRKIHHRSRRRPLAPTVDVGRHEMYLTAEEVGQLLGGN